MSPKKIHMLGICGTGMGSLAILLKEAGFQVTGSDENVYPPMSTLLEKQGIKIFKGYKASHVINPSPQPSPQGGEGVTVIIGNVISRGNSEAEAVLASGIKYLSMPQAVSEFFLKGKHSIVVAGTHGKTTTSSLCAWMLESAGLAPGFLIGGVVENFGVSSRIGDGDRGGLPLQYRRGGSDYFVIEGDEYDTAFFDKGPKFLHYQPKSVILGPVEFDHADIYKDLAHVMSSFEKLVALIPKDGLLVACADSDNTLALAKKAKCKVVTYGVRGKADYKADEIQAKENGTTFKCLNVQRLKVQSLNDRMGEVQRLNVKPLNLERFTVPMWGEHNVQNATGVIALLTELKVSPEKIAEGLLKFKNVKRRQEVRGVAKGVTVIDDFAHHPTAIQETIKAMKMKYKGHRLISVFEPRSNTSRRNIFQNEFADAFDGSDIVIISNINRPEKLAQNEQLNVDQLVQDVSARGIAAWHLPGADEIVKQLSKEVRNGDVVLIMSNGGFDNIHEKLLAKLK